MFAKLLKHELKASARLILGITLGVVGITVLCAVLVCIGSSRILLTLADFLIMISVFAIVGYILVATFVPLSRFYHHKFTDQGYLTFTIPATTHQILLSSAVSMMLWSLLGTLISYGCLALYVYTVFYRIQQEINLDLILNLLGTAVDTAELFGLEQLLSFVARSLCNLVYSTALYMLAVTLGATIAKKHKVLAAVGMYFAITTAVSLFNSILPDLNSMGTIAVCGMNLAVAVVCYLLTHQLVDKHLNLT